MSKLDTELLVEHVADVDLSDIHEIVYLDVLEVAKVDGSDSDDEEADEVYQKVMADFDYDGVTPVLRHQVFDEFLMLRGNWDGDDDDD